MTIGLLAMVWSGCGNEGDPQTTTGAASSGNEVRGEPIRGEPIVPSPGLTLTGSVASAATSTAENPRTEAPPVGGTNANVATIATGSALQPTPGTTSTNGPASPADGSKPGDALSVGFDKLASFEYSLPDGPVDTNVVAATQASAQIPETIKALNNRFISLKGFMLPLKVEKGLVTELLIMRDQSMCCYGTVPKINEWVSVKMAGTGVKPIMDQAVTLFGKLKVGEMYENGYLVGIYELDGERMAGPLDL